MSFEHFPYTNFHELNADWLLGEMKKVLTEWGATRSEWNNTRKEFEELRSFVNDYFKNLDVQEEINVKLDEMYASGELSEIIQPLFDTYKAEINSIVNSQNSSINVMKQRVDSLTKLGEGSTTGDAELQDGRIGWKGKTYTNIGEHIRTETEVLSNQKLPMVYLGADYPDMILSDNTLKLPKYTNWVWSDCLAQILEDIVLELTPISTSSSNIIVADIPLNVSTVTLTSDNIHVIPQHLRGNIDYTAQRVLAYVRVNGAYGLGVFWGAETKVNGRFLENRRVDRLIVTAPYQGILSIDSVNETVYFPAMTLFSDRHGLTSFLTPVELSFATLTVNDVWVFYDWETGSFLLTNYEFINSFSVHSNNIARYSFFFSIRKTPGVSTFTTLPYPHLVDGKWFGLMKQEPSSKYINYSGIPLPKTNRLYYKSFLSMSYDGQKATAQDIEIFENYLFVCFNATPCFLRIYDMETKELIEEFETELYHGSGCQFSDEYYDSSDTFPLLYVGSDTSNRTVVIRITNTDGVWNIETIRTLKIPATYGYWLCPSVADGVLYFYGTKAQSGAADMVLLKCNPANLSQNDDGTFTPEILEVIESPYTRVMQGRKVYNSKLYITFADTSAPFNAEIWIIDLNTLAVENRIDMTGITTSESEGLCFAVKDGAIKWYLSDYWTVYELEHYVV